MDKKIQILVALTYSLNFMAICLLHYEISCMQCRGKVRRSHKKKIWILEFNNMYRKFIAVVVGATNRPTLPSRQRENIQRWTWKKSLWLKVAKIKLQPLYLKSFDVSVTGSCLHQGPRKPDKKIATQRMMNRQRRRREKSWVYCSHQLNCLSWSVTVDCIGSTLSLSASSVPPRGEENEQDKSVWPSLPL